MKTRNGYYETVVTIALVALMLAIPFSCLIAWGIERLRARRSRPLPPQAESPAAA